MTKLEKSLFIARNIERYNEHFPVDGSPVFVRKQHGTAPPSPPCFNRDASITEVSLSESCGTEETQRRNTWSCISQFDSDFLKKKLGRIESRQNNSGNSVSDVIEECDSDEETDNDSIEYDYIRCINCSRSNSTNSIDVSFSSGTSSGARHLPIINFCYKCKHLKDPNLPAFYEGRRSSWTAGDSCGHGTYSPRRSRKNSFTDSFELPMISEPSFDENDDDTSDTVELQLRVEQEVDRLTSKYKTNCLSKFTF